MVERLRKICQLNGASGDEGRVREFIKSLIHADEVFTDNLGSLIAFKKGRKTPEHKIMFAAHMDEVGFMITNIDEDGFLCFDAVGGINPAVALGRGMVLESGELGVVGTKAIHQQSSEERKKMPDFGELYIDIGAS